LFTLLPVLLLVAVFRKVNLLSVVLIDQTPERVHSILNMKPLPDAVKNEKPKGNPVEFKNVSFQYSRAETDALQDVSFKVRSGETIALVGP
jgi:ATP-binding cassette subfamily B multidrug efflux pump